MMATGVPKKNGKKNGKRNGYELPRLDYSIKKSEAEILDTRTPVVHELWCGEAERNNRLYFGDNREVLATLAADDRIRGHVRLVYIDPPFATQTVFHSRNLKHAYEDALAGVEYIEFMRERLVFLRELLAEDGSIYVHIDDKMLFHIKVIMDEIFGADNFRNCITRKKCNPKNYTRLAYGNIADYILFYTKTGNYIWNRPVEEWTEERAKEYRYIDEDTGRRFMKVPVHAPGVRNGETGKPWRGMMPPPGKHWQFPPDTLDEMDARGEIFWSSNGNPRRKVYLDSSRGIGVQDIWMDYRDAHNQNVCITGYPTEKNPDLLRRIVNASSNVGDIVMDCFSGSGTTLAIAEELGRRWIGADNSIEAVRTTLSRFGHGTKPMGDFVGKRVSKRRQAKKEEPALFGDLAQQGGHVPVSEFSLYSDADREGDLAEILKEWVSLMGSGCSQERSDAVTYLIQRDEVLKRVIEQVGELEAIQRRSGFAALVWAIIGQQLSRGVAERIEGRLAELVERGEISARAVLSLSKDQLVAVGLSRRKAETIRELAGAIHGGKIDLRAMDELDDSQVVDQLCSVKGIGRWTAEMYLIFGMQRQDVLPLDDGALRRAMSAVYRIENEEYPAAAAEIASNWRPYRSIACRYLYRYLDRGLHKDSETGPLKKKASF